MEHIGRIAKRLILGMTLARHCPKVKIIEAESLDGAHESRPEIREAERDRKDGRELMRPRLAQDGSWLAPVEVVQRQRDAATLGSRKQTGPVLLRDAPARSAAISAVCPAVHAADRGPGNLRDIRRAVECLNDACRNIHCAILR